MISSLELARLCGVSQGTVDRALHARPGISATTRERILAVAAEHGYRANPAVLEVMRGRSATIGAIVPALASVFFADLLAAVKAALPAGMRLLVAPADEPDEFLDLVGDFAARRAAAVLVVPPREDLVIPATVAARMPVIAFASPCIGARFLSPDEDGTGRAAAERLLALGHRRIVHVTFDRDAAGIRARARGYADAMHAAGLEPVVVARTDADAVVAAVRAHRATALFCHNDWLALTVIRALAAAGLSVPGDVSVLGVDASPTFTAIYPGLASFAYPFADLARATAQIIAGEEPGPIRPCEAVAGGTIAPHSG